MREVQAQQYLRHAIHYVVGRPCYGNRSEIIADAGASHKAVVILRQAEQELLYGCKLDRRWELVKIEEDGWVTLRDVDDWGHLHVVHPRMPGQYQEFRF